MPISPSAATLVGNDSDPGRRRTVSPGWSRVHSWRGVAVRPMRAFAYDPRHLAAYLPQQQYGAQTGSSLSCSIMFNGVRHEGEAGQRETDIGVIWTAGPATSFDENPRDARCVRFESYIFSEYGCTPPVGQDAVAFNMLANDRIVLTCIPSTSR